MCMAHDGAVVGFVEVEKVPNDVTIKRFGGADVKRKLVYLSDVQIKQEWNGYGAATVLLAEQNAISEAEVKAQIIQADGLCLKAATASPTVTSRLYGKMARCAHSMSYYFEFFRRDLSPSAAEVAANCQEFILPDT